MKEEIRGGTLIQGFTLIEMMIVVAIIGILAALAVPSYIDHVRRGAIPEGLAGLSNEKVRMEQFFMDNRAYAARCAQINAPSLIVGRFTITCTAAADPNPGAIPP
ncbi:MAG: prepilin-type N-terminal cleavage/methylation domain-containing protein, partial [Burkholderiales bacterium]|nr:prepilin-type N-terminal cleavage/methylation domain-containing protein [Burkholderiales bacterium]